MAEQKDWEAIEASFRAGQKSVNAIAKEFGVSEGAIRKRAKKEGWQRDLSDSVRTATRSKLTRSVRTNGTSTNLRTVDPSDDAAVVEAASDEAADVVFGHRANLNRWRGLSAKLANVLDDMEVGPENHGEYARSLNAGVDAFGKVVKLERQAYGLDEDKGDTPGKSIDELMSELAEKEQAE